MKSVTEMRARLIAKAGEDPVFRARRTQDPKAAIEEEFDITLPDGFEAPEHEDSSTEGRLVLPPSPQLSEEQLDGVSGGISCMCAVTM